MQNKAGPLYPYRHCGEIATLRSRRILRRILSKKYKVIHRKGIYGIDFLAVSDYDRELEVSFG